VAVYPSRIRLKNSTDSEASIKTQLGTGGTDPILVGEVVVGRESGKAKLYTLDTAGAVVAIGGSTSLSELTDVNVNGRTTEDTLKWDGSTWIPAQWYEPIGSGGVFTGTLTQYPLHGTNGFYASQASMEAAGFTFITGSTDADDTYLTFDPGSNWNGINFLGLGISSANWFINTNGGVGCDAGGNTTAAGGNNALINAFSIDLYVSFWTQDTETRRAGWKVYNDGINEWLIVRMDQKVPYTNETGGFPIEAWFRRDGGAISVRYGNSVNSASFTVSQDKNLIVSNGASALPAGNNPFPGLTGNGGYSFLVVGGGIAPTGAIITQLQDVDTVTNPPTSGQVLGWDGSTWIPVDQTGGSGGGGGGGGTIQTAFTTETRTASGGVATFSGIGKSGQLVQVTSSLTAWIVLYTSAAARTADSGRVFGTDPALGSGVLAEFYVPAGTTVLATPGTTYFNNDTTKINAIYAAVRSNVGASVNSAVTLECYATDSAIGYRNTLISTTSTLADGLSADITFSGTGRSGSLISVNTDRAAWVVFYSNTAARTADTGRTSNTDPTPGSGVLAEVLTSGAQTVRITPSANYFNDETVPVSALYAKVKNLSGASSAVQVSITFVVSES
jgi:hypothetical protein